MKARIIKLVMMYSAWILISFLATVGSAVITAFTVLEKPKQEELVQFFKQVRCEKAALNGDKQDDCN